MNQWHPHRIAGRLPAFVRSHPDLSAVVPLLAISLATRVTHLSRPLHGDELITFSNMVLGRDLGGIVFGPFDTNSHLLNSLIMKSVHLLTGEIPAPLRLPNLLFGLLAVVLLYVICSRAFGRAAAFAAGLLFSLHPAVVLFSVWCRGYAGMVFFTSVSSWLFLQLVRSFSLRRLFMCSLTGFLAGAFHLFAVNVLIAQALLVVLVVTFPERGETDIRAATPARVGPAILAPAIALAGLSALYLPSLLQSPVGGSEYAFQAAFPIALANYLGGCNYRTDPDVFSVLLLALALIGFFGFAKNRTLRLYTGILFLSPVSLYALSFFAPVFTLHPRFFAYLLPFYCLLLIAGLVRFVGPFLSKTIERGWAAATVRGLACLGFLLIAAVFVERIEVPRGGALVRLQMAVGDFVDTHSDAHYLTNDTGFVRVRLRQEDNMDRILPALGVKHIREFTDREPTGAVYFIYVPRKRYTESDLIHYRGNVPPEVQYQRDERLRGFLERNADLELDLAPEVRIYAVRSAPAPLSE